MIEVGPSQGSPELLVQDARQHHSDSSVRRINVIDRKFSVICLVYHKPVNGLGST
jgi:hypothetical protein